MNALIEFTDRPFVVGTFEELTLAGAGFLKVTNLNGSKKVQYFSINTIHTVSPLKDDEVVYWLGRQTQYVNIERILQTVCEFYNVQQLAVKGAIKSKAVNTARQVIIYLAEKYSGMSQTELGRYFGRCHSTMSHTSIRVTELMTVYPKFKTEVMTLEKRLLS